MRDLKHSFNCVKLKIFDEEGNYFKQLISESFFIKCNDNNIKIKSNAFKLADSYSNIYHLLKKQ